ncbi:MAG TPA: universal stress protein [Drouetiella sp.]|jgi:nucleotide-binding universal stress UspA family protein
MKILLAVSDRFFGDALVDFALQHHWQDDAQYKLVKAIMPVEKQPGANAEDRQISFEEELNLATELLNKLCGTLRNQRQKADVSFEVLVNSPARAVVEYAKTWPADLIILGAHEQSNFERLLLGSVSRFIAEHAPCSLSIVRIPNDQALDFNLEEAEVLEELGISAS